MRKNKFNMNLDPVEHYKDRVLKQRSVDILNDLIKDYNKPTSIQWNEFKIKKHTKDSIITPVYKYKVTRITWFTKLKKKIKEFFAPDYAPSKIAALIAYYDPVKLSQVKPNFEDPYYKNSKNYKKGYRAFHSQKHI